MRQFSVTGMSCASCQARVEKAVGKVKGVESCSVSLLTNRMNVEGSAGDEAIIKAVRDAGYDAFPADSKEKKETEDDLVDKETPRLIKRLVLSLFFTAILMYFSMGVMMLKWPLSEFFTKNHLSIGIVEMFLASIVLVINQRFFISGFKAILHRSPNMDSLVALGSSVSYLWSVFLLLDASYKMASGDTASAMENIHSLYFESSAMILALITVGKTLEARSKGKTTDALKSLVALKSKTATLLIDGREVVKDIESVHVGDIFTLKSGERVPVDGTVLSGTSAVDESALTGESLPVDKKEGDHLSSGTINLSGYLICRADKVGEDTVISQIIKLVEETSASKAHISKVADRVSAVFVPLVMTLSIITCIVWLIISKGNVSLSLERAISVLVISCPCALGLATPVAIMVSSGVGAKNGILFKSAQAIEELGKVKVVALDKTGTITEGRSSVKNIYTIDGSESGLLAFASSVEAKSDHPLSMAVVKKAGEMNIYPKDAENVSSIPGKGMKGEVDGIEVYCGNLSFMEEAGVENISDAYALKEKALSDGASHVYVAAGGRIKGLITIADRIKDDSPRAIELLSAMGIDVTVITGDNRETAEAVCSSLAVKRIISSVLPGGKAEEVRKLKAYGPVAFVGDGINDSPALTMADVGIAIGSGTDIAIDSSSVVLMKSSLMDVVGAVNLSRHALKNIHENLFWAFIYNLFGIPLAQGVFIPLFGWSLNPMFGALAMSLSSFCVVTNALRLNLVDIYKVKNRKKKKDEIIYEENKSMEKTVKVDGMMCHHCEMRVENALKSLEGVTGAKADHEKKEVTIALSSPLSDEKIKSVIEKEGYSVIE